MRARYVVAEAALGLWRNVTMTVAMIITMAVSLTMLGVSGLLWLQIEKMQEQYQAQVEVTIFLATDYTEDEWEVLNTRLDSDPLIASYEFEDREAAYEHFKRLFADAPEMVAVVDPEKLPESFRIKLIEPELFAEISERYGGLPGVDRVTDQAELVETIFAVLNAIQTLALVGAAITAAAALMLVGNVIQVAAYSKRREVAVMKLVGAPNWFVQTPFVMEAMVAGLLGAILAFLALVAGKMFLLDGPLAPITLLVPPVPWRNVLYTLPLLAGAGVVVSAITGWITLRFYLKK